MACQETGKHSSPRKRSSVAIAKYMRQSTASLYGVSVNLLHDSSNISEPFLIGIDTGFAFFVLNRSMTLLAYTFWLMKIEPLSSRLI